MPNIGRESVGGNTRAIDGGGKGQRVTMSEAASAGISVTVWLADTAAGDTFQCALIQDADKTTVLAHSAPRTDISAEGWYTFDGEDFTTYAPANGQTFVIACFSNSAAGAVMEYSDIGLDGWSVSSAIHGINPPDLGHAMASDAARDYSIYMTYTASAGGAGVRNPSTLTMTGVQ
jgi:hypothetical protein